MPGFCRAPVLLSHVQHGRQPSQVAAPCGGINGASVEHQPPTDSSTCEWHRCSGLVRAGTVGHCEIGYLCRELRVAASNLQPGCSNELTRKNRAARSGLRSVLYDQSTTANEQKWPMRSISSVCNASEYCYMRQCTTFQDICIPHLISVNPSRRSSSSHLTMSLITFETACRHFCSFHRKNNIRLLHSTPAGSKNRKKNGGTNL